MALNFDFFFLITYCFCLWIISVLSQKRHFTIISIFFKIRRILLLNFTLRHFIRIAFLYSYFFNRNFHTWWLIKWIQSFFRLHQMNKLWFKRTFRLGMEKVRKNRTKAFNFIYVPTSFCNSTRYNRWLFKKSRFSSLNLLRLWVQSV